MGSGRLIRTTLFKYYKLFMKHNVGPPGAALHSFTESDGGWMYNGEQWAKFPLNCCSGADPADQAIVSNGRAYHQEQYLTIDLGHRRFDYFAEKIIDRS